MNHVIETLENRLHYVKVHLETVVTVEMKEKYKEQIEDLEFAIHRLKML